MAAVPSLARATQVEPRLAPEASATHKLYERHSAQLLGYCLHKLGSREEAEDAVQTTFLNAFRALSRGVVPQSESAWLFKIAENVCLSRHRSSFRRGRVEATSDLHSLQDVLAAPARDGDHELLPLTDALAGMPESQRRAILLREWQGLSYREIAAQLELSQAAVEALIFRARRSLAQGLAGRGAGPKPLRRFGHAFDLGPLFAAAKGLFAGGAAVKAAAVAVAVTGATVVAMAPPAWRSPQTSPAAARPHVAPPAQSSPRQRPSVAASEYPQPAGSVAARAVAPARWAAATGSLAAIAAGPPRIKLAAEPVSSAPAPAVEHSQAAPESAPPRAEKPRAKRPKQKAEVSPAPAAPRKKERLSKKGSKATGKGAAAGAGAAAVPPAQPASPQISDEARSNGNPKPGSERQPIADARAPKSSAQ